MGNAIPLGILVQVIAGYLVVCCIVSAGAVAIAIAARYSDAVHERLCILYGSFGE